MKQNNIISAFAKNNLNYENYLKKNIFDENFLNEKGKALSPIVLSDEIIGETIIESLNEKKEIHFSANEEKDIKYSSNIVYIESKITDSEEESFAIMNEQINKIITRQKLRKKSPFGKRKKKKK